MKIYTKKGDAGETSLYGGVHVPKEHLRIRAYGTLDELNAVLGIVLSSLDQKQNELRSPLSQIQSELFQLGTELATPRGKSAGIDLIQDSHIAKLETEIDAMEAKLAPLQTFILPGGSAAASHLHLARTTARRAERECVVLHRQEPLRPEVLKYINRLSDYLFVCARAANRLAQIIDIPWAPKKSAEAKS